MSKKEAIQICRDNGLPITNKDMFASKNKRKDVYWVNQRVDRLCHDWWLILNDYI